MILHRSVLITPTIEFQQMSESSSGVLTSAMPLATLHSSKLNVGIIAQEFPGWIVPFSHLKFEIKWIVILHAGWSHVIQRAHPKLLTLAYSDTDFSKLAKVEIVACNGAVPALRAEPLHLGSLYVFDTIFRPKGTWKQHWIPNFFAANHANVSGVTDFVGKFLMLIHNTSKQWFSFDGLNAIQHPNAPLSSILDCQRREVYKLQTHNSLGSQVYTLLLWERTFSIQTASFL